MAYLFRQKLYLKDLAGLSAPPKKILISEPESYLSALYGHYLEAHNFDIKHCPRLDQIKAALANFSPHLLLVNADSRGVEHLLGADFKSEFPRLLVVTTAYNLNAKNLGLLMNAGATGHINRQLTRPQDVVDIVKALLNN